jgi:hypothetical protein
MSDQVSLKKIAGCFVEDCRGRAIYRHKIRVVKDIVDYEFEARTCARHKSFPDKNEVLSESKLKTFIKERLLDDGKENGRRPGRKALNFMLEKAKETDQGVSMKIMIDAARYFAKIGDSKFSFGFMFNSLIASTFTEFGCDIVRRKRALEIRSKMSMREPYAVRQHPDHGNDTREVCRCGHTSEMHDFGPPRGECYTCMCPRYEFEQKLTLGECIDLGWLLESEIQNKRMKASDNRC